MGRGGVRNSALIGGVLLFVIVATILFNVFNHNLQGTVSVGDLLTSSLDTSVGNGGELRMQTQMKRSGDEGVEGGDNEPLRFFSSDFHISPVADIKNLLKDLNVQVIDKSLSGHCHLSNTCERDLRVITKGNGIHLDPCPNDIRRNFYSSYRCDSEFAKVDAFLCNHAAALCEVFMPFNTSIIVIATTRYEIGRHNKERWQGWNENLRRIAANPYNVVAANNKYDQEYIKYFTGIDNVLLLPSYCGYIQDRYKPTRTEILIAPARGVCKALNRMLVQNVAKANLNRKLERSSDQKQQKQQKQQQKILKVAHIRDLYPHFKYSDIAAHPAIIILPYQIRFVWSTLSHFHSIKQNRTISLIFTY